MFDFNELWKIRLMFPELTEAQFQVLTLYAFGIDNDSIAEVLEYSVIAIKKTLQRIKNDLHVEKLATVRVIYHVRTNTAMIASPDFSKNYYRLMSRKKTS